MSNVAFIESQIRSIEGSISVAQQQLAQARAQGDSQRVAELNTYIGELNQSLAQANANLQAAKAEAAAAPASSGQVVAEEQRARADGATASTPSPPASVLAPDGRVNPNNVETGTNEATRTTESLQSTPAPNPNNPTPVATQTTGVGAGRDDATTISANSTQQIINANFSQRITPRANVLDQYASYTYSLTWYMLTPDQFNQMQLQERKDCASWSLLVQSGGAAIAPGNSGPGRNPYFKNDYYLDDLVIEHQLLGKGTGSSHNVTDMTFTVTEPNGFTLIENLYLSAKDMFKRSSSAVNGSYQQTNYCMVIRFYGYDDAGNLVQAAGNRGTAGSTNRTDPKAVVERFIPFNIKTLTTRIANRAVIYNITAAPTPYTTAFSAKRGTIPFPLELVGTTVNEVLNGRAIGTTYQRDEGRQTTAQVPTAPSRPTAIDTNQAGSAQVDEFGNFTGASNSPFQVGA